jgi:hypothetical protein
LELAGAVLAETRAAEQRLLVLPARAGIYFVLALGLSLAWLGWSRVWCPGPGSAVWCSCSGGNGPAGQMVAVIAVGAIYRYRARGITVRLCSSEK